MRRGEMAMGGINDAIGGGACLERARVGGCSCFAGGRESHENSSALRSTTTNRIGDSGEGMGATNIFPWTWKQWENQVCSMPRMPLPTMMPFPPFTLSLHQMHPYQQFITPIHFALPLTPQPMLNSYMILATHFSPPICPQLVWPWASTTRAWQRWKRTWSYTGVRRWNGGL